MKMLGELNGVYKKVTGWLLAVIAMAALSFAVAIKSHDHQQDIEIVKLDMCQKEMKEDVKEIKQDVKELLRRKDGE